MVRVFPLLLSLVFCVFIGCGSEESEPAVTPPVAETDVAPVTPPAQPESPAVVEPSTPQPVAPPNVSRPASVSRTPARMGPSPYTLVGLDRAAGKAFFRRYSKVYGGATMDAVVVETSGVAIGSGRYPGIAGLVNPFPTLSVDPLGSPTAPPTRAERMARPELARELAAYRALFTGLDPSIRDELFASSRDGRQLLMNVGDYLYRSHDGGATYTEITLPGKRFFLYEPAVSLQGDRGAFRGCKSPCRYTLWLLEMRAGTRPRKVSAMRDPRDIVFSADGRHIYAVQGRGRDRGKAPTGCLLRLEVARPTKAERIACHPFPSYNGGPDFVASADRTLGVVFGEVSDGGTRIMPYTWFNMANPSERGTGSVPDAAPNRLSVHGPSRRAAWRSRTTKQAQLLDLRTGKVRSIDVGGFGEVHVWDANHLLTVDTRQPSVSLVEIPPS